MEGTEYFGKGTDWGSGREIWEKGCEKHECEMEYMKIFEQTIEGMI